MSMPTAGRFQASVIFGLVMVHFTGDFFFSFVNPLLPVLADNLALTMTQVGVLAGLTRFLAFIVQPTVGYLADRHRNRWFLLGGPIIASLTIPMVGLAGGFWMVLLFFALGSVGQSMFHPPAAGMVTGYAGRHVSFSMAVFTLGGTAAFGIGPLFVTWWVSRFGMANLPYTALLGLLFCLPLFVMVPRPEGEGMSRIGFWGSIREALGPAVRPMAVIWFLIFLRTYVSQSIMTFGLVMFNREGYSLLALGRIQAAYIIAAALSGLAAGHLADRIGFKPLFYASYALAAPSLYLFLNAPGDWVYPAAFAAGFITLATMPLAVAMAQNLAPKAKSLVSSLMMGLAFGAGGSMTPLTGWLSDVFSIRTVLSWVIFIPLFCLPLVVFLPKAERD
jgi:FSR family fosmidomycin resistance protein-like MFS transporter